MREIVTERILELAVWGIPIAAAIVAAAIDLRHRRIPNRLTGPLLLAGLVWGLACGGLPGLKESVFGLLIAGAPFVLLWLVGGGGAGDAKLMLAIGTWLGPQGAIPAVLAVAIAGGVLSIGYAISRHRVALTLVNTAWTFACLRYVLFGPGRMQDRQQVLPTVYDAPLKVPYAVAILAGTCAAALWTAL